MLSLRSLISRVLALVVMAAVAFVAAAPMAGATIWSPSNGDEPVVAVDDWAPVAVAALTGSDSWTVDASGAVTTHGNAPFLGDLADIELDGPIVDIAATPSGMGYVMAASDGGVFAFGDAQFHGSAAPFNPVEPIVALALTEAGYLLAAADGGVFAFGDAAFLGSGALLDLDGPIVDIAGNGANDGYVLAGSDGGVLSFGTADFEGSLAGELEAAVTAIARTSDGYLIVADTGEVIGFGDAVSTQVPLESSVVTNLDVAPNGEIVVSVALAEVPPAPVAVELTEAEAFVSQLSDERLAIWDALAHCESTGRWDINTGNGYYGGIQFAPSSWWAVGGEGYPHQASRIEQIYRGELLLEIQGWRAWPGCSRKLGLR